MNCKFLLPALSLIALSCSGNSNTDTTIKQINKDSSTTVYKLTSSIPEPTGYKRIHCDSNSFTAWLRSIALKKDKTVYLFNGDKKNDQSAQFAVLDISVGDKNLQQCADAVMRLRAEYLFATKQFSAISFTDNEGSTYPFVQPYSKEHLQSYLPTVFGMCGSASLSKQLKHANISDIKPGDVFIRGGFPGHAEIVMDVAVNNEGKKIFLLAQGYMPAQDIHILVNPTNEKLSPWYEITDDIICPEYTFTKNELKTW